MSSLKMLSVQTSILGLTIVCFTYLIRKWRNPKSNGKLPPGSSGIPLIGECLELLIPNYTFDLQPFIKKRVKRYGSLFRTNILGQNVVVSTDAEFNQFIFQQEEKSVIRWNQLFNQTGESRPDGRLVHKYMRNLVLSYFGSECIKQKLLSQFQELVDETLHSWSIQNTVEVKSASVSMYGAFGSKVLYGGCEAENAKVLAEKFITVLRGQWSFPLNIPGTSYHKCQKVKSEVKKIMKDIIRERCDSSEEGVNDDLVGKMIKDMDKEKFITEEFIAEQLFGLSFATFESIASVLAFALKFIGENPAVLQELIAEHDEILKNRTTSDSLVSWEEYKSMTFTLQVVNETLRLGNVIPGFLRKTIKDVKVNGYTIPSGWGIMVCYSAPHLDPSIYENPVTFNPWRWKDVDQEFIQKNLTPFAGGIVQCAGADFSRASMIIFLHVLVTKYRYTVLKGGEVIQNPMMHFKNGLHISVSKRSN